jgi:starch-binding outer membrane protein, SusD/RagB family
MNRIANKVLAVTATLLILGMAGCTDPSVAPSSTISEGNIFKDPGSYRAFLAKLYAGLSTTGQKGPAGDDGSRDIFSIPDEGFSQYVRLYWEFQELPSDEAVIAWGDPGLPEMNTQLWGSTNPFIAGMFARLYFQIVMANEFLRQTSDDKLSERGVGSALRADIQTFRAEARFLRALSYWHGLDLYGNIPLVTSISTEPPSQNTRTEVYDFIVSELTAIRGELPPAGPGVYGRATDAAADMLLAHVYLNAEVYTGTPHYGEALAAASAAIAGPFSLDPNYEHLFQADNNTSPEMIFPVTQDGLHTQSYGGTTFLIHASCGNTMDPATYGIDGCWWGIRLKPEAYNRFAAGDSRSSSFFSTNQTVGIATISDFSNGIPAPKYQNVTSTGSAGSNPGFPDTDYPMFRLADAYLIYAEAQLRGGGGTRQQALDYVNALRVRAYGDSSGVITDPELTLDFILDERGRELFWEGQRRSDLIRYGRFTGGAYLWTWKGGSATGVATDAFRDLYPLPAAQLVANPKLKQNTGY